MMVYFRKRIKLNILNKINQEMVKKDREIIEEKESDARREERGEESERPNAGKLILDATARLSIAERLVRPLILSIPQI